MSPDCNIRVDQLQELIEISRDNLEVNKTNTQTLNFIASQNKDVVRYLLIVVCIIALGKSALDAAKSMWGQDKTLTTTNIEARK